MGVKLKAANGGGSVELDVPSTVNSDITLTLPATDGAAEQVLKTNGSGALDWVSRGVLQIHQATHDTMISSNSTAWVSCGTSVAFNIIKASSKCLVNAHTSLQGAISAAGRGRLRLRRTIGSTTTTIVEAAEALVDYSQGGVHLQGVGFTFLDTHGVATAGTQITYHLEFSCNSTNGPVAVNNNGITLITVMEVDG